MRTSSCFRSLLIVMLLGFTFVSAGQTPDKANGPSGGTVNNADIAGGTSTENWLANSTSGNRTITANVTINSLIEEQDVFINNGATLTLVSGSLILRSNSFWMQTSAGATGFLTSGTNDLYLQADGGGGDQAIKVIIKDGSAGALALRKSGSGLVKLSQINTYTGGTVVNQGTLDLRTGGASGCIRGTVTVNPGGVLQFSAGDATGYGGGATAITNINLNGGNLNVNVTTNQTLGSATVNMMGGSITGNAGSNIDFFGGGSTLNTFASLVSSTISGVPISPLRQGSTTFTVEDGPAAIDLDISSVIQATPSFGGDAAGASLIKAGAGVMRLSAANTYTGGTVVIGGMLEVTGYNGLLNSAGFSASSGGTLKLNGQNLFTLGHYSPMDSARIITIDAATLLMDTSFESRFGNVTLKNGAAWTCNRALTNFDALLADTDAGAATVLVTNSAGTAAATMNGAGGIHLQGVQIFDVADVTGNSASDLLVGVILGGPGAQGGAAGGIDKKGTGTMTLFAANTFTGNTIISAGTLALSGGGSISNSVGITLNSPGAVFDVSVATFTLVTNQTLAGIGMVSGTVNVAAGGVVAAGTNNTGNLTLAALILNSAAKINVRPGAASLIVTGANGLTTAGAANSVTINLATNALAPGVYTLIDYNGSIQGTGFGAFRLGITPGRDFGYALSNNVANGSVDLVVTPPPDPFVGPLGNLTYTNGELFKILTRFTSTNGAPVGHGFVAMNHGYLAVVFSSDGGGGNGSGGFAFYDVSNPRAVFNTFTTQNNPAYTNTASTNYAGDIREAHSLGFSGNHVCLTSNRTNGLASGLQFWDWSNIAPSNPVPVKAGEISLPGLTGGDYAPTPWWACWQGGRYAYVGGTSGGLYIVDASDPAHPVLVNRGGGLPNPIPTSQTGGFRLNTMLAVGNLLVSSASDASGMSTFDISDPANPVLLKTISTDTGLYSIMVNGDRILGAHDPAQVWDISNPANIALVGSGPNVADKGGYGTFQDGIFHYGSSSSYVKLDVRTLPFTVLGTNAPTGFVTPDWDFATVLGNLVFVGNDHSGSALVVHQLAPDTNGPLVNMVVPRNGATNQAITSRVGLTFTDQIELRSVNTNTLIVRPVGGAALSGRYSHQTGIVNFWPDQPLLPGTTYEVVVPSGGVRDYVGNGVASNFLSTFTTAAGSNVPLNCVLQINPPATPGLIPFSASATGTGTIQYSWSFGDGSPVTPFSASATNISHNYAQPGHFPVVVTVSNGVQQTARSFVQTIYRALTTNSPTASGTIIIDTPSNRVWCVNADSDTVSAIHATTFAMQFEKPAGKNPRTLAQAPDGTIWVVNQAGATISVLNRADGNLAQTIALPRASRPYGIAFAPDGGAAYVTLQGTGRLLKLNPATRAIIGDIAVNPSPRGIAVSEDSQRILVTRFVSPDVGGEVTEVNAASFTVTRTFNLALSPGPDLEDSGRGLPNYISSITISPDGLRAWIPSKKDNIQRGVYRDGNPLTFESMVRTIVSQIDLQTNAEDLPARIDLNDRDLAFAARFSPLGDYVFAAVQGANSVDVLDAYSGNLVTALENTGLSPQGLALSADGRRLFVNNFMSRTVKVYDTTGIVNSTNSLAPVLATVSVVSNELLPAQVLLGKQIFYNAQDNRMNRDHYISCASCHLDGGNDGRTWDFTDRGEGLRNTIALIGRRGVGHGRVHWTANFDEVQDFEHDIRGPFGGTGFMGDALFNSGGRNQPLGGAKTGFSPELDQLTAYVSSLTNVNPSPYRNADGSLTGDGQSGKALFRSLNCASCHSGSQFTDSGANVLHDVGTIKASSGQRLGQPLTGLDTPTLKGIWETAPYFHDGSVAALADVFNLTNGLHGSITASLTAPEKQQFVSYLLQIDEAELASLPAIVPILNAGSFGFSFPTLSGFTYAIEFTPSLSPINWQMLQTIPGDGSLKTFSEAPTNTSRFYRVSAH